MFRVCWLWFRRKLEWNISISTPKVAKHRNKSNKKAITYCNYLGTFIYFSVNSELFLWSRKALSVLYLCQIHNLCFYHRFKRVNMWKTGFLLKGGGKKGCWNNSTYWQTLCTFSSNAKQERGTTRLNVAMCDDCWRSDGLNGIWLKSVDGQLSLSHFFSHTSTQKFTDSHPMACRKLKTEKEKKKNEKTYPLFCAPFFPLYVFMKRGFWRQIGLWWLMK